ncbi:PTS sugar transporter subunit IIC [Clostridium sp. D2Q-14]|uniref:PTS sugar transporter subunit IIC n=1 Tax=Anaeromonas gelatinilytica TaxID=2683194 RepID=UPI00193BF9C9|nr:PTS sugar transporter subunit IIC [Anaeromonas gelatinilytica]MBS4536719.1 PTS sugar transporter subunit IIC [Anaeromonas gelatinilytica]
MMDKFMVWLDEKFSTPMAKLAEQRHLRAVRDGIVATLPIIIVGSFFLILAYPPVPKDSAVALWAAENIVKILLPYRLTMYIMSLYASWGIGYSLSKSYNLDGVSGGNLAVVAFLMTIIPQVADEIGWALPMANLGGSGMFVAIVTSIFAVEIMRLLSKTKFKITMPEQVPSSVARSFEALTPTAVVVILMTIISVVLEFDWHGFIAKVMAPLISTSDTIFGVLFPVILITLFWSAGIHGVSVVGSVARPVWTVLLDANTAAAAEGAKVLPHIAPEPFYQWFIWLGGSGATIGLVLLLAFVSKSKYSKTLGRTALAPGLFNINEPLIFGAPIVLNPILIIPFVLAPLVNAVVSYVVMSLELVARPYILAPWTLPGPIGAYLATGGDWKAIVLNLVCIVLSVIIYYPFFKMYDNKQLELEQIEKAV